jgi:hypothetical protein
MADMPIDAAALMPHVPALDSHEGSPVTSPASPLPSNQPMTDRCDTANINEAGQESVVLLEDDVCAYSLSLSTSAGPSPGTGASLHFSGLASCIDTKMASCI